MHFSTDIPIATIIAERHEPAIFSVTCLSSMVGLSTQVYFNEWTRPQDFHLFPGYEAIVNALGIMYTKLNLPCKSTT